jgi:hypothetical protein
VGQMTTTDLDRAPSRSWVPAKLIGGLVWSLLGIALFTPWFRHAPCPLPNGCDAPWSNILGWEFRGGFPLWVPIAAGSIGFAVGWMIVAVLQRPREHASA